MYESDSLTLEPESGPNRKCGRRAVVWARQASRISCVTTCCISLFCIAAEFLC